MRPLIGLPDFSDPSHRAWAIGSEPAEIHRRVGLRLLVLSSVITEIRIGGPAPEGPPLPQFLEQAIAAIDERRVWGRSTENCVLSDVVHKLKAMSPDGLPLSRVLQFLERLTIDLTFRINIKSGLKLVRHGIPLEELSQDLSGLVADHDRWIQWYVQPEERELGVLKEYDELYGALAERKSSGRPLRFVLRDLVSSSGRLTLSSWSCQAPPPAWDRLWDRPFALRDNPSEWAEQLLALKARCNSTTPIKEQLARERKEQKIQESWEAYGRWLLESPDALRQLESWLGDLMILLPSMRV